MNLKAQSHAVMVLIATFTCTPADAGVFSWTSNSGLFPNQVDPTVVLNDTAIPENPALISGVLILQTDPINEVMNYLQPNTALTMPSNLVLEGKTRYVSGSTDNSNYTHTSMGFTSDSLAGIRFFIGVNEIFDWSAVGVRGQTVSGIDTSVFHTYTVDATGTNIGDSYTVSVDGTVKISAQLIDLSSAVPLPTASVYFGDGTLRASGVSEWQSFSHNAATISAGVPEPSTGVLLCAPLLGLFKAVRRNS